MYLLLEVQGQRSCLTYGFDFSVIEDLDKASILMHIGRKSDEKLRKLLRLEGTNIAFVGAIILNI